MGDIGIERLQPGDGARYPQAGQTAVMHYIGTLTDGKKFDSSRDRGAPFKFVVGQGKVIKAWDMAVPQMSVGETIMLTAPSDFAYGDRGYPGVIPPKATLKFEMQLLGIE